MIYWQLDTKDYDCCRLNAAHLWCADELVGNITTALTEKGMLADTVIAFQSDNGAERFTPYPQGENFGSNYPLRGIKRQVRYF